MKNKNHITAKGLWFVAQAILIFISIEAIAFAVGHFDAVTTALVLLGLSAILILAALYNSIRKDKKHKNGFAI